MKRTLLFFLAVMLALTSVACGGGKAESSRKTIITEDTFVKSISERVSEDGYTPLTDLTYEIMKTEDGKSETHYYTLYPGASLSILIDIESQEVQSVFMSASGGSKEQGDMFASYIFELITEFSDTENPQNIINSLNEKAQAQRGEHVDERTDKAVFSLQYSDTQITFSVVLL